MKKVIIAIVVLLFTTLFVSGKLKTKLPLITKGWDYSLPKWVKPALNSSINTIDENFKIENANINQRIVLSWAELEPEEGVYKFEEAKNKIIDRVKTCGLNGVELSLRGAVSEVRWDKKGRVDAGTAPKWLIEKYKLPLISGSESDMGFTVISLPIWNKDYQQHYLKFIDAFGKSGIPQMKEVEGCYVHAISGSRGEEASFKKFDWCIQNLGLTPEIYINTMKMRFDAIANAFKSVERKLLWVGHGTENGAYPEVAPTLIEYAYKLGMGQRCGFVEVYLMHLENKYLGQYIDTNGYLTVDEECPPIKFKRSFGDENEEYTLAHQARFGDLKLNPSRYRESMLRTLQMRRNSVWISKSSFDVSPELTNYVALELGRDVFDTPDVWVYLRESYLNPTIEGVLRPVKNFERWLYQREEERGYKTVACMPEEFDKYLMKSSIPDPNFRFNNTARRTDIASGNKKIGFAIDDRFIKNQKTKLQLNVTYYDNGNSTWKLNYKNLNGKRMFHKVKCTNSGEILTAKIQLDNPDFSNIGYKYDFEIEAGKSDVAVSFVRLIKLNVE